MRMFFLVFLASAALAAPAVGQTNNIAEACYNDGTINTPTHVIRCFAAVSKTGRYKRTFANGLPDFDDCLSYRSEYETYTSQLRNASSCTLYISAFKASSGGKAPDWAACSIPDFSQFNATAFQQCMDSFERTEGGKSLFINLGAFPAGSAEQCAWLKDIFVAAVHYNTSPVKKVDTLFDCSTILQGYKTRMAEYSAAAKKLQAEREVVERSDEAQRQLWEQLEQGLLIGLAVAALILLVIFSRFALADFTQRAVNHLHAQRRWGTVADGRTWAETHISASASSSSGSAYEQPSAKASVSSTVISIHEFFVLLSDGGGGEVKLNTPAKEFSTRPGQNIIVDTLYGTDGGVMIYVENLNTKTSYTAPFPDWLFNQQYRKLFAFGLTGVGAAVALLTFFATYKLGVGGGWSTAVAIGSIVISSGLVLVPLQLRSQKILEDKLREVRASAGRRSRPSPG